jgi:ABC-type transporter Mla maintaining outer membrane lipid asymmetry ATPase subunit MlaF
VESNKNLGITMANELAKKYINSQKIAQAIALAVQSGQNLLLYGPGGYGKSVMTLDALKTQATKDEIYIKSFGEGLTEDVLWGGDGLQPF